MELTNQELEVVHTTLYNAAYYGDDDIVYGDGPEAVLLRSALEKVTDEARRRKLRV
jgi:predicted ABC-class ATPase